MNILNKIYKFSKINKNKISISFEKEKISYKELWEKSNSLASFFKKNKYTKICILENNEDDCFYYIAIIASLISGSTYIPISAGTPKLRINKILNISKANLLISNKKIFKSKKIKSINKKILNKLKIVKKNSFKKYSNDAYIIFTSGSTGEPKGVRISRNSLNHYIEWITNNFFIEKNIKCSQHPSIGFDLSVADIFGTLCSGGTLFPIKNEYEKLFLGNFIEKNSITHWVSVPSAVDLMVKFNGKKNYLSSLKKIFFCGEPLKEIHLKKIFKNNKNLNVMNTYGPTEATVSCTYINLNSKNYMKYCKPTLSIGKSIPGMKIQLVNLINKNEGEIFITGPQVSNGYINDKIQNKKKFLIKKKRPGFYTGDICKKINKNFYFKHRIDRQVKVFGHRIELDEIDNKISNINNGFSHSIVYNNKIISFTQYNFKNLKYKLKNVLPKYMIPNELIILKNLPKNKNYKVDENKLIKKYKKWKKK